MMVSAFAGQGGLYGIVNGDGVRLRTSPDTSSLNNVIGLLYEGERLNITSTVPSWAYGVMADGDNAGNWGYVYASYLDLYQQ